MKWNNFFSFKWIEVKLMALIVNPKKKKTKKTNVISQF